MTRLLQRVHHARYVCGQIEILHGTTSLLLSILTYYTTFLQGCKALPRGALISLRTFSHTAHTNTQEAFSFPESEVQKHDDFG
jgi:hypothetical protein